jgi:hypothetical protein
MSNPNKKAGDKSATEKPNDGLESLATRLEAMATEATELGEDRPAKAITKAAKSCRSAMQQRAARFKKVGSLVANLKAKGMTAEQIVAELTR